MNGLSRKEVAEKFHALHHSGETLLLFNVWDCLSAKIAEQAGFPAVATSSAGVAWANGRADGEQLPPQQAVEAIQRIAAVVQVPVTADIEGGYFKKDINAFCNFINQIIDAGAVGINLEDGNGHSENLNSIKLQTTLIQAAKACGRKKGINLFVNARTDSMLLSKNTDEKIRLCIERAQAFTLAGADGIFIPFVKDMDTVAHLKSGISLPLNILLTETLNLTELEKLKVNRVSTGARPIMAIAGQIKKIATSLKQNKDIQSLFTSETSYAELNNWFQQ